MNFLFNKTKESLLEQRQLLDLIKFADKKLNKQPPNTITGVVQFFYTTSLKAFDHLDFAQDIPYAENFAIKMQGMALEYITQAIINSGMGRIMEGMPYEAEHRSVWDIPDKELGSPDLVAKSQIGGMINISVKSSKDLKHKICANKFHTSNAFAWQRERFQLDVTDPLATAKNMIVSNVGIGDNVSGFDYVNAGSLSPDSLGKLVDGVLFQHSFWDKVWAEMDNNVSNVNFANITAKPLYPDQIKLLFDPIKKCTDTVMTAIGACSVGKSEVFRTLIEDDADSVKVKGRGIYVISSPRIALNNQHNDTMHSTGRVYDVTVNCSGGEFEKHWGQSGVGRMSATTNPKKIAEKILEYLASGSGKPHLIFSTDIGLPRLEEAYKLIQNGEVTHPHWNNPEDAYSTAVTQTRQGHFDEAHNFVVNTKKLKGRQRSQALRVIRSLKFFATVFKKIVFWTATKKVNGLQYDMNNTKIFGRIVAVYDFKTAVANGRVLQPYMATVTLNLNDNINVSELNQTLLKDLDNDDVVELTFLVKAIKDHKAWCDVFGLNCQIMYFGTGVTILPEFKKFLAQHFAKDNLWVNYVTADTGNTARQNIFSQYERSKFGLLMNYDIIGEGINIQSTTAVVVGRGMNDIKLVQSALRGTRLHPEDRKKFAKGLIKVGNEKGWKKPFSWLYTFSDQSSLEDTVRVENAKRLLEDLRTHGVYEYGITVVGDTGVTPSPRQLPEPPDPVSSSQSIEDMLVVELEKHANSQYEQKLIDNLDVNSDTLIEDMLKIYKETETV
jgi:hypothetical protein